MSEQTYDVIIVGAGSAGAALASRLTEDSDRTVLLLESGPNYTSAETIPEIQNPAPGSVNTVQQLAQTHTYPNLMAKRSSVQEPMQYFRGRGVGGSSSVNGLFFIRPTVEDFDGWAEAGAKGWSYEESLPLLNKMENDLSFGDAEYHGNDGPLPITRPRRDQFTAFDAAVTDGAISLGHAWVEDHNAPNAIGVSPYAYNGTDKRVSTNDAYLEPARARDNFTVLGDAHVDKVIFEGKRAVGVLATINGETQELRANEIVVSGGAIHSPAILQRSGVGPAEWLNELGIEVVADLPVGKGLQEHAGTACMVVLNEPLDYGNYPPRGQVCLRFSSGVDENEPNDLMIAIVGALGLGMPMAGICGWVNHADSVGTVKISSTDPLQDPEVDFNMLSTETDMKRFRVVVEELRKLALTPQVKAISSTTLIGAMFPAEDELPEGADFEAWALGSVMDTVHGTSTCKIGAPGDPTAVVDPEGRVYGLEGLRVCDASILPWTTRANTNLAAIFVGEKIAQSMRGGN